MRVLTVSCAWATEPASNAATMKTMFKVLRMACPMVVRPPRSFHAINIRQPPALVEKRFGRSVGAEPDEEAFAGHRLNPVAVPTRRRGRPEVKIHGAVGICFEFVLG